VKEGPQDGKNGKIFVVVRLTLVVEMRVLRTILSEMGGAHLNESPALPELPIPPLPGNVIVSGFID
jgi:hypothetical protein